MVHLLKIIELYGLATLKERKKIAIKLRKAMKHLIEECFYCEGYAALELEEFFETRKSGWSVQDLDEMHRDVQLIVPPPERR